MPLQRLIRHQLQSRRYDLELIDELTSLVWLALFANDGRLLARFDESRGVSLLAYLREIVRDVTSRYFRTERRRRQHERASAALRSTEVLPADAPFRSSTLQEFMRILTPAELKYFEQAFVTRPETHVDARTYSQSNRWQLNRRIVRKFEYFLRNRV